MGVNLAAGETLTVAFDARIAAAAPIGTRNNTVSSAATDGAGSWVPANCIAWIPADTDPTDTASASIRITQPGVLVTKSLATTQDAFVQVNQAVGWRVTVKNTGDTTLTTVPLVDTYDTSRFGYVTASPLPNGVVAGTLSWTNLGTIAPGASRSVTVTLNALSVPPSNTATNAAGSLRGPR